MKTRRGLVVILTIIFLVSLSYSFYYQIIPGSDALGYDRIGWNLARGLGYIEDESNAGNISEDDAIVRVGPGYEFFLAGLYKIFGHNYEPVWILHGLLRVVTALFIFLIVGLLFKDNTHKYKIAIIAILLYGLSPDLIVINGMLLMETLFIALLVSSVYFLLKVTQSRQYKWSLAASILLGLAAIVRPTALVVLIIFVVYFLMKKYYAHALVVVLCSVILLGGWSIRNSMLYDTPLFTTTAGSYALWVGNNGDSTGGFDKTPEIQAIRDANHSVPLSKIAIEKYKEFLVEHPFKFIELQFRKTAIYFSLAHPTGSWGFLDGRTIHQISTLFLSFVWVGVLLLLGLAGIAVFFSEKIKQKLMVPILFLLVVIAQPPAVIITYVESRYRYPFFSLLTIFAAFFIVSYWHGTDEVKKKYRSIAGWIIIILLFFTSYDLIYNAGDFLSRIESVLT